MRQASLLTKFVDHANHGTIFVCQDFWNSNFSNTNCCVVLVKRHFCGFKLEWRHVDNININTKQLLLLVPTSHMVLFKKLFVLFYI